MIEKLVPIICLLFIWKKKRCALLSRIERLIVVCQLSNFSAISWQEQFPYQWYDGEVCCVLDQAA